MIPLDAIYIYKIAQTVLCVRCLLLNGLTLGDDIWHADAYRC